MCNLGSCPGTTDFGCRRQWEKKNNNAITVEMAGKRDPLRNERSRSAAPIISLERPSVRPPGSEPASMRKFGEYVFLEDSRYARQAKSACALPLGARALA
jgi:hypothetical protein